MSTVPIAPMLSVRHRSRAVAFYKAAFGAHELFKIEAPDGGGTVWEIGKPLSAGVGE